MRLIYTATQKPVQVGDRHTIQGFELVIGKRSTPKPHKPGSEGKIYFEMPDGGDGPVYYASVIGAQWVEREDRAGLPPVRIARSSQSRLAGGAA